ETGLVGPDGGHLGKAVAEDQSFRPSPRSSLNFQRVAWTSVSPIATICAARTAAFTAAFTPTVATGTPVGICAVMASASFPTICGDEAIGTPITGRIVLAATAAARCPEIPVEQITTLRPRSDAVRAYSSTRSGFRDDDMMLISCCTPNFSRMSAACRMIGNSDGDAASTPTLGASLFTSTLPPPPYGRCRVDTA